MEKTDKFEMMPVSARLNVYVSFLREYVDGDREYKHIRNYSWGGGGGVGWLTIICCKLLTKTVKETLKAHF